MISSQFLFSLYGFLPEFLLIATFVAGAIVARREAFATRLPAVLAVGYLVAGALVLLLQLPLADNAFKAEWLFQGPGQPLGYGMVVIDGFVVAMKLTLLIPLLGAELSRWLTGNARPSPSSIFQCSGLLGLWLAVGADDLLTLFAGLELVGISTWKMLQAEGGNRRVSVVSSVAGTPAMLLGIGFILSFTSATNYATINNIATAQNSAPIPVLPFVAGNLLLLVGIALRGGLFPSFTSVPHLPDLASRSARLFLLLLVPVGVLVGVIRLLGRAWPMQLPDLHWQPFVGGLTVMVMLLAVAAMLREQRLSAMLAHLVTASIAFIFLPILPFQQDGSPYVLQMLFGVATATIALLLLLPESNNGTPLRLTQLQSVGRTGRVEGHLLLAGVMLLAGLPWGILFTTRPWLLAVLADGGYQWIAWMGAIALIAMWAVGGRIAIAGYRRKLTPAGDHQPLFFSSAPIGRWRVVVAALLLLANIASAIPPISNYLWLGLQALHDPFAGGWG